MLETEHNMSGDDDQLPTFGERLRWARVKRGLQGTDLAQLVKREQKSIYRYEGGTQMPSRKTMKKLAQVLKVSPVWLEYGRGQPNACQEVEDYLLTPQASKVSTAVAEALLEMPWAKMGMANPRPEQVNQVRILLELLMGNAGKRTDGDKGG